MVATGSDMITHLIIASDEKASISAVPFFVNVV